MKDSVYMAINCYAAIGIIGGVLCVLLPIETMNKEMTVFISLLFALGLYI